MIRSEKEYREALERLRKDEEVLALQKEKLEGLGLSEEEVRRALEPMLCFVPSSRKRWSGSKECAGGTSASLAT